MAGKEWRYSDQQPHAANIPFIMLQWAILFILLVSRIWRRSTKAVKSRERRPSISATLRCSSVTDNPTLTSDVVTANRFSTRAGRYVDSRYRSLRYFVVKMLINAAFP